MIEEIFKAFILIFIAEMGDKTQILAMAFAIRFPVKKVLLGIFLGSLLNHGLAVALGSYISNVIPINTVQIIAGFAFLAFSLWTLKIDEDDDENSEQKSKFGPIITVALAFFIGELGDKTQITAITLSTDAIYPLAILGGTVLGMTVTGGIAIIIGKKLGDKIPEFNIKIIAAAVFMFFGITKLYKTLPGEMLNLQNISIFLGIIFTVVLMLLRPMVLRRNQVRESAFRKKSRELYNYYHKVEENVGRICLGEKTCGKCQGNNCIVGFTKTLIRNGIEDKKNFMQEAFLQGTTNKHYDKEQVIESLRITLAVLKNNTRSAEYENIHEIRKGLEIILFNRSILEMNSWNEYKKALVNIDKNIATRILQDM